MNCEVKRSKATRTHKCDQCGGKIKGGQKYERSWSLSDGEAATVKTCNQCLNPKSRDEA